MKCTRCGGRVTGATWYCKHCGSAMGAGGNYFDSPRRLGVRFFVVSVATIATVAAVSIAAGRLVKSPTPNKVAGDAASRPSSGQLAGGPASTPWPTPSPVPVAEEAVVVDGGDGNLGAPDSDVEPAGAAPSGGASSGSGGPVEESAAPPADATTVSENPVSEGPVPPAAANAPSGSVVARSGAPIWTAGRPPGRVILDGQLDDWVSSTIDVAHLAFGETYWDGPADLSAAAFSAFDAANLYVAVRVTDDTFSQTSTGADLHLGDSIEVQLDTDLVGDFAETTYSADDWQIGLSPGDFAGRPPEAFVWRPEGAATGIRVAARKIAAGYIVEASIPWLLLGVNPAQTPYVGFAVNVSDNDYPGPAQVTMVSSVPRRSWDDPRSFGTLILKPAASQSDARP